ncbi:UNVERIFIED_CONTAM: hypothetical protein NCL1_36940 [Trichonephila clavipes]
MKIGRKKTLFIHLKEIPAISYKKTDASFSSLMLFNSLKTDFAGQSIIRGSRNEYP